ncbi:MAG: peptide chain release factor 1 [Candidatus Omnitrophica bacterium]|nr:peptide chain release factor 1 [Candidatus Omnitrophota bacterium]MDD5429532.1 peptide chain release factor 1 [Candidatus Omnitrophota bacterium]
MLNLSKFKQEYQELSRKLSGSEATKDRDSYAKLAKRFSYLEKVIALDDARAALRQEVEHLKAIVADSSESQDMKDLAREEIPKLESRISSLMAQIEEKLFEEDVQEHDVIIEIRAAAGGEESALFGASLFKMYSKYAELRGWKFEVLSSSSTEIGGYKEVVFSIKGKGAWNRLKFESGVHRVQRVPVTESGGRIHTSTVTVAVLVEPKEVDVKINPEDLKIDTYRASGAGGQHVNVTDSAVRITHLPTGTIVSCQDERSQIKNRAKAMRVIKAKIMEKVARDETNKVIQARRTQVGTGDRSEKIRTYNFPERRVTDHRINFTIYRLEEVLQGDMDEVTNALLKEERRKMYEAKGLA